MNSSSNHYLDPLKALLLEENFERLKVLVLAFPFLAALVAWVLRDEIPLPHLILWYISLLAVSALTQQLGNLFVHQRQRFSLKTWAFIRVASSFLNALIWGGAAATILYPADIVKQVFLLLLVGGTTGIAVSSSASYLPALLVFQLVNLLPLVGRLLWEQDSLHTNMAGLVVMHLLVVLAMGVRVHRTIYRSFELELANQDLVERLTASNESLNRRVEERTAELSDTVSAMVASEAKLARVHTLLEFAGLGVLVAEPDKLTVLDFNVTAASLLGVPPSQLDGMDLRRLEVAAELKNEELCARLEQGETLVRLAGPLEYTFCRRIVSTTPYLLVLVRDVSDRIEWERQLRQSQKMHALGRLAGEMAHEFNNLLMAISGFAELLSDRPANLEDTRQILAACKRGKTITNQLLTFSSDGFSEARVVDLLARLESLRPVLTGLVGDGVKLELTTGKQPCPVFIEPAQFDQILVNLALNARQAMDGTGSLEVTLKTEESWAVVEVGDTGPGVDATIREHIFEPFFTTREEGSGLGLSLSFGLAKRAGGELLLQENAQPGACFQIRLPLADAPIEAEEAETVTAAGNEEKTEKLRVLLVEDQPSVRMVVQRGLQKQGYEVTGVGSAEEALEVFRESNFDLLLSDVVLPKMSGIELYKQLNDELEDTVFILMSGCVDGTLDDFGPKPPPLLRKPFRIAELMAAIEQARRV